MDIERPKLSLKITPFELILNIITVILFIASLIYLVSIWGDLPKKVPAHYNASGEVDRWGNKLEMIFPPIIALVIWIGITVLEKYPHVFNYMKLTKENVRGQYLNARLMLNVTKNMIVLIFTYLIWKDIQVALGHHDSLGSWFMITFFALIFIPMGYYIIRSFRIKK